MAENTPNTLNTGKMLADYMDANNITLTMLAKKLNRLPNSIFVYRGNSSMPTKMLETISHELQHNFFADLAAQFPANYSTSVKPNTEKDDRIAQLELEIIVLKSKNEALMEALKGK